MVDTVSADGDEFAAWVAPHWTTMVTTAARLTSPTERDDVLQDTLALAWRTRASFNAGRGSPRTWLVMITVDQCHKAWRRRRATAALADQALPDPPNTEVRLDVERALSSLTERQRSAVSLFYYVGLSITDVAEVMHCAEGTVKATLSQARAAIRIQLGKDYE